MHILMVSRRTKSCLPGWAAAACLCSFAVLGQTNVYLDNAQLEHRMAELRKDHPELVRFHNLVETKGRHTVALLELGSGSEAERNSRPALLAVAGLEANDMLGPVSLLAWAESILNRAESEAGFLTNTTLYILPRGNPDGADRFFQSPSWENAADNTPVDDDHDGLVDEDGPEDLDGDGKIATMRIQDPDGEYILDPEDNRLLVKADPLKGESGAWRVLTEGRDQDGDEQWNEDGLGGVNLNRNFPYNYQPFAPSSGLHPVSQPETRALADFVVAHPNIALVFTFGSADNLANAPNAEKLPERKPATGVQPDDQPLFKEFGQLWRESLGLKKELAARSEPGSFSDWIYFHRGRLSLAARPWSPALQLELAKATSEKKESGEQKKEEAKDQKDSGDEEKPEEKKNEKPKEEKKPGPNRNQEDREFLKWLEKNHPEGFTPWRSFDHPQFPGKTVEIGGVLPWAKTLPPEKEIGFWVERHLRFLEKLPGKLPRIALRKTEVKSLGQSVFEVKIHIENRGYMPTHLAHGSTTGEVVPTRLALDVPPEAVLAGPRQTSIPRLAGSGGMREVKIVLLGDKTKRVPFRVVSALGGVAAGEIRLEEQQ